MVHEFNSLLPVGMLEDNKRLVVSAFQLENHLGALPFIGTTGTAHTLPRHEFIGLGFKHIHVTKAKVNDAALAGISDGFGDPPMTQPVDRGKGFEHFFGNGVDSHSVQYVRHE